MIRRLLHRITHFRGWNAARLEHRDCPGCSAPDSFLAVVCNGCGEVTDGWLPQWHVCAAGERYEGAEAVRLDPSTGSHEGGSQTGR